MVKDKIIPYLKSRDFAQIGAMAFIFVVAEIALRAVTSLPSPESYTKNILIALLMSTLFSYSPRVGKVFISIFVVLALFVQIPHAIVYGSWIDPINIFLLLSNLPEVLQIAAQQNIKTTAISFSFLIFSFAILIYLIKKSQYPKTNKWLPYVILLLTLYYPLRYGLFTPDRIEKLFIKDTHGIIWSSYKTFSLVVAMQLNSIIGEQLYPDYIHEPYKKLKEPTKSEVNVLVYFGESLGSKYMSLFDYEKDTTPYLKTIKSKYKYSIVKEAISGSTDTVTSTSLFFNLIPHPDGRKQISSSRTSLFKYARGSSYNTGYLTTQAIHSLNSAVRKIGKEYIDIHYYPSTFKSDVYGARDSALDDELLSMYDKINLQPPFFLVIQPRGSHVPFNKRTTSDDKFFGTGEDVLEYENSVLYTDGIIRKLLEKLKSNSVGKSWLFIMTSDHGTYTDNKIITRSIKYPSSYIVPCVIITNDESLYNKHIAPLEKSDVLFHHQIAKVVARILGYDVPFSKPNEGVLSSRLLSGVGGTKKVKIINKKIVLEPY